MSSRPGDRRRLGATVAAVAVAAALSATAGCEGSDETAVRPDALPATSAAAGASVATPREVSDIGDRFDIADGARVSNGGPDPRGPDYWLVWNTCAQGNRADEVVGTRFVLVDDVLADPGLALGDHRLASCDEAAATLAGGGTPGENSVDELARQLLAAELNLNVGAENCTAAEQAVISGQVVLASAGFDGSSAGPLGTAESDALPQIVAMLSSYNVGQLCR